MATENLYADSHEQGTNIAQTLATTNQFGAPDGTEGSSYFVGAMVGGDQPWFKWGFDDSTRSTFGGIVNSAVPKIRWKVRDFDYPRFFDVFDIGVWVESESTFYTLATYGSGTAPPASFATSTFATVSGTYINTISDLNAIKFRILADVDTSGSIDQTILIDAWTLQIDYESEERRDVVLMVLDQLRNNMRTSLASTTITTTWYNQDSSRPQVTVGQGPDTIDPLTIGDTARRHLSTVYVDTWIGSRAFGGGMKRARYLLDDEVQNVIDTNRKDPESPYRWMHVTAALPLDEITDERRVFRTRHTVVVEWYEDL
jgi:hypothetical protein